MQFARTLCNKCVENTKKNTPVVNINKNEGVGLYNVNRKRMKRTALQQLTRSIL